MTEILFAKTDYFEIHLVKDEMIGNGYKLLVSERELHATEVVNLIRMLKLALGMDDCVNQDFVLRI